MIGNRLKEERERVGLTQTEFSEVAGAKKRTLIDWEKGVSSPTIVQLSALIGIGVDALYVLTGLRSTALQPIGDEMVSFSLVPFYDVEASAGSGSLIDQELKSGDMAFRNDWLMSKGLNAGQCALIKARGDSMEPTICDGDLLLIDMRVNEIKDDSIYILQVDHHLIVKRVQQSLNSTILIISDNKRYETQTLTAEYSKELKVVGRLRWYGHEI